MERNKSWCGAAVHEIASPLYKGNNEEEHTCVRVRVCVGMGVCVFCYANVVGMQCPYIIWETSKGNN